MAEYRFDVDGDPKAQPRIRIGRTPSGRGVGYDPGTANGWKEQVQIAAKPVRPAAPLEGPLSLRVTFRFDRPQSHRRKNGTLKPGVPGYLAAKGRQDADNLAKSFMDALTTIRFWADDGLVADLWIIKRYVMPGERPGATALVTELSEP